MARALSKRVKLNLVQLDKLQLAVADGLSVLGEGILAAAAPNVPDDPSTAKSSIAESAGWLVLNGSRKVGGPASKPKTVITKRPAIITLAVGYGAGAAHLLERGTTQRVQKTTGRSTGYVSPRPWLLPAIVATVPKLGPEVGKAIEREGFGKPG